MNTLNRTDFADFNNLFEPLNTLMENQMELAEKTTYTEQDLIENANLLKKIYGMVKQLQRTKVSAVARTVSRRNPRRTVRYNLDAKMALGINKLEGYVICSRCDTPIKKSGLNAHQARVSCKDKHLGKVGCHLQKKIIHQKIIFEKLLGGHLQNRKKKVDKRIKNHIRMLELLKEKKELEEQRRQENKERYELVKESLFKCKFGRSDYNAYLEEAPLHLQDDLCEIMTHPQWYRTEDYGEQKICDFDFMILHKFCHNHYCNIRENYPKYSASLEKSKWTGWNISQKYITRTNWTNDKNRTENKKQFFYHRGQLFNHGMDRRLFNHINKYFPSYFNKIFAYLIDDDPTYTVSHIDLTFFCRHHIKKVLVKKVQHLNQQ